jgi:hypothetical protein
VSGWFIFVGETTTGFKRGKIDGIMFKYLFMAVLLDSFNKIHWAFKKCMK